MNPRAVGCAVIGIVAFVGVGLLGLFLALPDAGCPTRLQWAEFAYVSDGSPVPEPTLDGEELVVVGTTFIGIITRDVHVPQSEVAAASGAARPSAIVLDCGDGTYLAYRRQA